MQFLKRNRNLVFVFSALIVLLTATVFVFTHSYQKNAEKTQPFLKISFQKQDSLYADSVLKTMRTEQKVSQLFIVETNTTATGKQSLFLQILKTFQPCGVFINDGNYREIGLFADSIQQQANIPYILGINAPYGLFSPDGNIKNVLSHRQVFSYFDPQKVQQYIELTAMQMKQNGLHMNMMFPLWVLNETREYSWEKSYADFINRFNNQNTQILQNFLQNHLLCCAYGLSFPTKKPNDSIYTTNNFYKHLPLMKLIYDGLPAVCFENSQNAVKLTDTLRNFYKYHGLVICRTTENLNEDNWILKFYKSGGSMLMIKPEQKEFVTKLTEYCHRGDITQAELDKKVKHILMFKSWLGLRLKPNINADSAAYYADYWKSRKTYLELTEQSIVLLHNKNKLIPLMFGNDDKIAVVHFGNPAEKEWIATAENFTDILSFRFDYKNFTETSLQKTTSKPGKKAKLILLLTETPEMNKTENIEKIKNFYQKIPADQQFILVVIGSANFLARLPARPCMLWCPLQSTPAGRALANIIFGGESAKGSLAYTISDIYCRGDGLKTPQPIRFKYTTPEDAGIDGKKLYKIDSIAEFAINHEAFPGCQVFFARNGKVFYHKSFGTHTYDKKIKVKNTDLYDVASITKIAATTLALMSLYDKNQIKLDTTLNYYFDDLDKNAAGKKVRNSRLNYITLRELLTHCSGLPEGLPIGLFISPKYALQKLKKKMEEMSDTLAIADSAYENGEQFFYTDIDTNLLHAGQDSLLKFIFSNAKKPDYTIEVAKNVFLRTVLLDSLWQLAKQSWMRKSKKYLYSDLNMFLVMKVVEKVARMEMEKYLDRTYYALLNLKRIGFHPLKKFKEEEIVPTEDEKYFRKQLIHGYVHDPMAALLGGVGGNAGLFSNAHDLAVLMQMLLNGGTYGGKRFLSEKTVALFTSAQNGTYRGLGFDRKGKPDAKMIAPGASMKTYGHTGFTGTCVWVDPEYKLIYVFLSNRVHPKSSNQKINIYRIRQNIHQVVYDAMVE